MLPSRLLALRPTTLLTASHLVSYYEELYRRTIARELLAGLHAPSWSYQADRLPAEARTAALHGADAAARWYRLGVGDAQSP